VPKFATIKVSKDKILGSPGSGMRDPNCAQLNERPSPDISKALAPVKSTDVAVMVSRMVIEWPQAGLSLQINKGSHISSATQSQANGNKITM